MGFSQRNLWRQSLFVHLPGWKTQKSTKFGSIVRPKRMCLVFGMIHSGTNLQSFLVRLGLGYHHCLKKVPRRRNPSKFQFLDPKSKIAPPNPVVWQKKGVLKQTTALGLNQGQNVPDFIGVLLKTLVAFQKNGWFTRVPTKRHCYNPHSTCSYRFHPL